METQDHAPSFRAGDGARVLEHAGPSAGAAARRHDDLREADGDPRQERRRRPYPRQQVGGAESIALAATRALLRATTREEAALILRTAIEDLGGVVVPACAARNAALPLDVSLGLGEPAVVEPLDDQARVVLAENLPDIADDAHVVVHQIDLAQQQTRLATIDALTGAATRREIGLRLGRAQHGDAVCVLDLDGFKRLNDSRGHAAGDDALRDLGRLIRSSIRPNDFVGRYGGDEFVIVLWSTGLEAAKSRMESVAASWRAFGDHGTTTSIGVAAVDDRGGAFAARAADAALYRAKRSGRDRVEVAHAAADSSTDDQAPRR